MGSFQCCAAITAVGYKHQIDIFYLTRINLVAESNHVARLQSIVGLEQIKVVGICFGACDVQRRAAKPCIVPVESSLHRCSGCSAKHFARPPPAPCGQIVLNANVIPLVGVLAHTLIIEELAVAKVEICDERLSCQIPAKGALCSHELRHSKECFVEVVAERFVDGNVVQRRANAAGILSGEPAFKQLLICQLRFIWVGAIGVSGFPEHIGIVTRP